MSYIDKITGLTCSGEWLTGNFGQYYLIWRLGNEKNHIPKQCSADDSFSTIALCGTTLVTGQRESKNVLIWDTKSSGHLMEYDSPAAISHCAISPDYIATSTVPYPCTESLVSSKISTIFIYNRGTNKGYQFQRYGQITSLALSDDKLIYLIHARSDSILVISNLGPKDEHLQKIKKCGEKTSLLVREHFILIADGSSTVSVFDMHHLEAKKERCSIS